MDRQLPQDQRVRILVIDDHELFRAGVGKLIDGHSCLKVVADCGSAEEGRALAAREQPQVILLDLDLGQGPEHGLEAITRLLEAAPEAAILVVTRKPDKALHEAAMLRGARGVITKDTPPALLLKALERVFAGEVWIDRAAIGKLLASARAAGLVKPGPEAQLTAREREIIALICEGLDNGQIAARLNLSTKTIRNHLSAIFNKLGVKDRLGLAICAFRLGLVCMPRMPGTAD
jgi:two-component system, NarL family, nitrate/nitrite response regulator NarL